MKKCTIIFAIFLFWLHNLRAQDEVPTESTKEIFFKHQTQFLTKDGGLWEAINPGFSEEEQYSARSFQYEIKPGIHSEQVIIKIKSDIKDIGWYISWDGYYLWDSQRNEVTYHSIGGNGAISKGVVTTPDENTHVNVFEIKSYEGRVKYHKDITKKVNDDEMHSESYDLTENGDWVLNQRFIWKRIKKG